MQSEAWHKQQEGCVFPRKTTVNFTLSSQSPYCNEIKETICCMVKFVGGLCQLPMTGSQGTLNDCNVR